MSSITWKQIWSLLTWQVRVEEASNKQAMSAVEPEAGEEEVAMNLGVGIVQNIRLFPAFVLKESSDNESQITFWHLQGYCVKKVKRPDVKCLRIIHPHKQREDHCFPRWDIELI